MIKNFLTAFFCILIFFIASYFRLTGLNWDADQHLHPDERFLTMVSTSISWPVSFSEYFHSDTSPLNPHNVGYNFYVYGTFPVYLVKAVAGLVGQADYNGLTLVGRTISAAVDLLTLLFVYLLTQKITSNSLAPVLALFFYAVSVLSIQLSHFYAVDTFLTLFITLSLYLLVLLLKSKKNSDYLIYIILLGFSFGFAVSSKITALLILPVIGISFLIYLVRQKKILTTLIGGLVFVFVTLITVRLAYPYLFSATGFIPTGINPKVLANWRELARYNQPNFYFPPGVSWVHVPSYLYPLENMMYWGWGIPLFIIVTAGLFYSHFLLKRNVFIAPLIVFTWVYFIYQGQQYTLPLRYFHPLYPVLAIFGSLLVARLVENMKKIKYLIISLLTLVILIWPISFISIYHHPHPRIQATNWIYSHLSPGSRTSCEYWDDCLPLNLPNSPTSSIYTQITYPLYDAETPQKWQDIKEKLVQTDYLILSSNRLYGSIMTTPEHYPDSNRFYSALFTGQLGFIPVAQFTSRPNIPLPFIRKCFTPPGINYGRIASLIQECDTAGITFVDDYADESYTVYDHPKVIIFQKTSPVDFDLFFPVTPELFPQYP